jgi:hypothetical protein
MEYQTLLDVFQELVPFFAADANIMGEDASVLPILGRGTLQLRQQPSYSCAGINGKVDV